MTEGASLASLLGDVDQRRFADDVWARAAWSRKGGEGPDLTSLLSLDDVDELLASRALRTPFLRVAKDGVVLDPARYTGGAGVGALVADQVDGDRLVRLLDEGCTVVFQGLHRAWAPLRSFADALARELGHPVQVNAYLTPEGAQGFDAHYDTHDVFVVQTAGTKEWRVHEPVVARPRHQDEWARRREEVRAAAAGEPALVRTLEPGDVVYLPRGWIHSARANAGLSLHLTFGIHPYTRRHLADAVVARALLASPAGGDPLDVSLPVGFDPADPAALDAVLAEVRATLVDRVGAVASTEVSAVLEQRWAGDTRPDPLRPVRQLLAADALGPQGELDDTVRLRARTGLSLRVEVDGAEAVLVAGGRRLPFDAGCAGALGRIATGVAFRVSELAGEDADDVRPLVQSLLISGAIVVVDSSE